MSSSSKSIKWDESQSPQWRYLLSQESRARKGLLRKKKSIEEITGEGEIKRNKQSVRASHKKRKDKSSSSGDLGLTKKGRKIVYSASPGHGRYTNSNTTPTNHNNNNNDNEKSTTRLPTGTEEQE
jgi:predicted AAA+ superfamily ATPase